MSYPLTSLSECSYGPYHLITESYNESLSGVNDELLAPTPFYDEESQPP